MKKTVFFAILFTLTASFVHAEEEIATDSNSNNCKTVIVSTITLNNRQVMVVKDASDDDEANKSFVKGLRNKHTKADLAELCDMSEIGMQMFTMEAPANSKRSILKH
jgi:hypothetical protein